MSLTVRDLRQAVGQIVFQVSGDAAQVVFDDGQITGNVSPTRGKETNINAILICQ
jgi:hypothetical protein